MKTKKAAMQEQDLTHEAISRKARVRSIEGGAVSGAVVGAAAGVFAGPAGALAGGVVGVVAGAVAGAVLADDADRQDARTSVVDHEIGVIDGDIGEPSLRHPPDSAAAYFAAAAVSPEKSTQPIKKTDAVATKK